MILALIFQLLGIFFPFTTSIFSISQFLVDS